MQSPLSPTEEQKKAAQTTLLALRISIIVMPLIMAYIVYFEIGFSPFIAIGIAIALGIAEYAALYIIRAMFLKQGLMPDTKQQQQSSNSRT